MDTSNPSLPWEELDGRDSDAAWRAFIAQHSAQIMRLARYHAHDDDKVQDCFLYVCEKLWENDCRRLRQFASGHGVPFEGWLNAVVNNLCHDWRRAEFGRPRTPQAILALDPLAQQAYQARFERHLELVACLELLQLDYPELDSAGLSEALARAHKALSAPQRWRAMFLNRAPEQRTVSLQAGHVVLPLRRAAEPDQQAETSQDRALLRAAMTHLDPTERLMLRLRFEEMLPLEEVARMLGLGNMHQARRRIESALTKLRQLLPID